MSERFSGEGLHFSSKATKAEMPVIHKPDDLETALVEGGIIVVEEGEVHNSEINPQQFSDLPYPVISAMQELATRSANFLSKRILTDKYENSTDRHEWKSRYRSGVFSPETVAYLDSSRLSVTAIHPVMYIFPQLRNIVSKLPTTPETTSLLAILDSMLESIGGSPVFFKERYENMSVDERVELVTNFSNALRAYLDYVAPEQEAELERAA